VQICVRLSHAAFDGPHIQREPETALIWPKMKTLPECGTHTESNSLHSAGTHFAGESWDSGTRGCNFWQLRLLAVNKVLADMHTHTHRSPRCASTKRWSFTLSVGGPRRRAAANIMTMINNSLWLQPPPPPCRLIWRANLGVDLTAALCR